MFILLEDDNQYRLIVNSTFASLREYKVICSLEIYIVCRLIICYIPTIYPILPSNLRAISTVFTNNRSQAVRLPAKLRLPDSVKKVNVRTKGSEIIISPVGKTWDSFFFGAPMVTVDFMDERDGQEQHAREEF